MDLPDSKYAADLSTGFFPRLYRDLFYCRTGYRSSCQSYGARSLMVCIADSIESTNLIPDTTIWFLPVLSQSQCTTQFEITGNILRHNTVCNHSSYCTGPSDCVPTDQPLATRSNAKLALNEPTNLWA